MHPHLCMGVFMCHVISAMSNLCGIFRTKKMGKLFSIRCEFKKWQCFYSNYCGDFCLFISDLKKKMLKSFSNWAFMFIERERKNHRLQNHILLSMLFILKWWATQLWLYGRSIEYYTYDSIQLQQCYLLNGSHIRIICNGDN